MATTPKWNAWTGYGDGRSRDLTPDDVSWLQANPQGGFRDGFYYRPNMRGASTGGDGGDGSQGTLYQWDRIAANGPGDINEKNRDWEAFDPTGKYTHSWIGTGENAMLRDTILGLGLVGGAAALGTAVGGAGAAGLQGVGALPTNAASTALAPSTASLAQSGAALTGTKVAGAALPAAAAAPAVAGAAGGGLTTAQMVQAGLGAVAGANSLVNANKVADIADKQLGLAETAYNDQQKVLQTYEPMIKQLIQQQIDSGKINMERSNALWSDYESIWRPVERQLADTALAYNTGARRDQAARDAQGQVASSFDSMRQTAYQDLVAAGHDPSTIAALNAASQIEEAKASAGAGNQARREIEDRGLAMLDNAARFGRGLPAAGLSASQAAGNSATSATNQIEGLASSSARPAATANNLFAQAASTQTNANAQINSLLGDLFGAGFKLWGMTGGK